MKAIRNYATQMDAAKRGIITPEMEIVAAKEGLAAEILRERIARGTVVIPANIHHVNLDPEGVGEGLKTKINVNLGISKDCSDFEKELGKVRLAIDMKAEAIMDLSSYGKTRAFRKELVALSTAMIGTVPVYDAMGFWDKELEAITAEEFLLVLEEHGKDGVDFITVHAGLNREAKGVFERNQRITHIVSRGGSLTYVWMEKTGRENPFYEFYDDMLDICRKYDMTLSLGDAMRPGCIHDATDASQIKELMTLGELTKRAWAKDVQVMIEGPGHMAINEIAANVTLQKRLCHGAPFYVLGPLVTDVAPGYDHITSAIGGAIAASAGADFLCYVTPAEHLRLPDEADVKEGIIAAKIAAHAGDIAKGVTGARVWDDSMSQARQALDWEAMFKLSIDPDKARSYRLGSPVEHEDSCSMCGKMCSMRNMNQIMKDKKGCEVG